MIRSSQTLRTRRRYLVVMMVSIILNAAPMIYYSVKALINSTIIIQKAALVGSVFIVVLLTVVSWIAKLPLRSRVWIILIGLSVALPSIEDVIILTGSCQLVDELIFSPLTKYYKSKLIINKEIDRRG